MEEDVFIVENNVKTEKSEAKKAKSNSKQRKYEQKDDDTKKVNSYLLLSTFIKQYFYRNLNQNLNL